jgi:hypothetical protein
MWLTILAKLFQLAPVIYEGIESIHKGKSTETKTQLATEALKVATGAAEQIDPADAAGTAAFSNAAAATISAIQYVKGQSALAAPAAPAPAATASQPDAS